MTTLVLRLLVVLLVAALGTWVAGGLYLWSAQESMLFPGAFHLEDGPAVRAELSQRAVAHGVTEHHVTTEDGIRLLLWHHPAEGRRAVLYIGGNAERIDSSLGLGEALGARGWDLVVVAVRGFPGSEGLPTEVGVRQDALAAWRFITDDLGIPADHVVLHGRSMGGGVIGTVMHELEPAGVIMESTFDSIVEMARLVARFWPVDSLLRHRLATVERAPLVTRPVLQVHSRQDEVVPFSRGLALSRAWTDATFVAVDGIGHQQSALLSHPDGRAAWSAFLARFEGVD